MNSKARHGIAVSVEEQWPARISPSDEEAQLSHCFFPERTKTNFLTFALDLHRTSSGRVRSQILNRDSSGFTSSRPRVLEKQQQGVIPLAILTGPIWCPKKFVDFIFLHIRDWNFPCSLEWNASDLCAPFHMLRATTPGVPGEGMERRKPLVSGGNRAISISFQVREEIRNDAGREVANYQFINCCPALCGDERQEQTESTWPISIAVFKGEYLRANALGLGEGEGTRCFTLLGSPEWHGIPKWFFMRTQKEIPGFMDAMTMPCNVPRRRSCWPL